VTLARLLLALPLSAALAAVAQEPTPAPEPGTPTTPSDERLRKVQERRRSLEGELGKLRSQEKSLLGEVERLELEERLAGEKLRETRLLLERTNAAMDQTLRRVQALTRSVDETRPVLAARARSLYKLGELSYLRLLLSVDHPSDIFRGYRFVTALARRDNQRMAAFRADLAALAATKAELEKKTSQALALRADLERARQGLDADRKRKTALLTQIVEKKELHAAYLKELEEAEAKLTSLLQGLGEGEFSVPIAAFKGSLPWPATGRVRTPFGLRKHARFDTYTVQNGIEIEAAADTPVAAVHEGSVVFADRFQGYGLLVVLDHGGKHHSLYAHLGEVKVQVGQRLPAGALVGTVGAGLEGAGLYFEMRFHGRPEDPLDWLKKPERAEK
jgi:septal ring factor EnvC (AmiA/AmiB activator)